MIKVPAERMCDGSPLQINGRLDLGVFARNILEVAQRNGINLEIAQDECKVGGGLFTKAEPCVVVYNADHKRDYYSYVFTTSAQGNFNYLLQYAAGESKNWKNQVLTEKSGFVAKKLFGPNKQKQNEEHMYYQAVQNIFSEALSNSL
ncbi:MAG: hypothetical protein ACOX1S_03890 [Anaerostipes sp.]